MLHDAFERSEPSTFAAFGQLMHVAVDVGIARGALEDGCAFLRERARPWLEAGVERAGTTSSCCGSGRARDRGGARGRGAAARAVRDALDAADAAPARRT